MTGHSPSRRLLGALAVSLLLAGVLASCGESRLVVTTGSGPFVPLPPVAQITVPPGETPAALVASPTPRVAEAIVAVTPVTAVPTAAARAAPAEAAETTAAPTAVVALTGAAEVGRQQFTAFGCIACHGADLSGGIGPQLSGRTADDLTEDRIREQAKQGGNGMPAFPNMTEQELQNFISFIRSQA